MNGRAFVTAKECITNKERSPSRIQKPAIHQSSMSPVGSLLFLQRTIGNQAVLKLLKSDAIQAKLKIGQPGDIYEQEADRVAEQVMRMTESGSIDCQEEKSPIQTKPIAAKITPPSQVAPGMEAQIVDLRGGGQPLSQSTRAFFEPRFGYDFSRVRVHTDVRASTTARALNARAFTVGQNIAFRTGDFAPYTDRGKRLLAHELTHVVQQDSGKLSPNHVSRWTAQGHQELTEKTIDTHFKDKFSFYAREQAIRYSGKMDLHARNYYFFWASAQPKKSKDYYMRFQNEATNHGEANMYIWTNQTQKNIDRMNAYKKKAISLANSKGIDDISMGELGNALHVAQDRGAHGEGLPREGHKKYGKKADDFSTNSPGKSKAEKNSRSILQDFIVGLTKDKQRQLKSTILPAKSVMGGIEVSSGLSLVKGKKLFYFGLSGYGILSNRFLIFSPVLKAGYSYFGGKKHLVTATQEVGLRLVRPTSRIYVDVLTGAALGYNITDKNFIAGISGTISAHYTGRKVDLGVIFQNIYNLVGRRHNIMIIGVSVRGF